MSDFTDGVDSLTMRTCSEVGLRAAVSSISQLASKDIVNVKISVRLRSIPLAGYKLRVRATWLSKKQRKHKGFSSQVARFPAYCTSAVQQ